MKKQVTFCDDEEVLDITEDTEETHQNKQKKTNHQESGNSKLNQDMDDLQQQINRAEDVMRGLNLAQDNTNIPRSEKGKKKSKYAVPNPLIGTVYPNLYLFI